MGQYHRTVNLDKREYLNPHALGDGLKLKEQGLSGPGGVTTAIHVLLAVSNGRGGGDYGNGITYRYDPDEGATITERDERVATLAEQVVGRWGGDRIAIVGDYAEPEDLPVENAKVVYEALGFDPEWTDITELVREYLAEGVDDYHHAFTYGGDNGWIDRTFDLVRREGR